MVEKVGGTKPILKKMEGRNRQYFEELSQQRIRRRKTPLSALRAKMIGEGAKPNFALSLHRAFRREPRPPSPPPNVCPRT